LDIRILAETDRMFRFACPGQTVRLSSRRSRSAERKPKPTSQISYSRKGRSPLGIGILTETDRFGKNLTVYVTNSHFGPSSPLLHFSTSPLLMTYIMSIALITGASSGLGKALAVQLTAQGFKVYCTSRSERGTDQGFEMLTMDVRNEESVRTAVSKLIEREGRIDVLVNNAGVGIAGPMEQLGMDYIQKAFDTNVFGMIRVCQAVLPHMRKAGSGKVVNISSIGAAFGLPYRGAYCATKSSVDILTEALRMETSRFGIQACSIRAGDMQTDINANRLKDFNPDDPAYSESFQRVYALVDEHVENGMPVEEAARQIATIIGKPKFKRIYTVGKPMQKLSIAIKQLLPSAWFEAIIRKYSKM
jgi:NAD(P)-dependent dehydrogenase (short-subunit alcohol dehydrogenase family)